MRHSRHAALAAVLASLALAPAASAAPLLSQDADPLVSLDDTDASAMDWQLRANPAGANGLSFFGSWSANPILSLGSNSNVGIGEVNPVLDLEIHTNNTPAIRLEQDNTGGWTAQTWDIGANEANFFVRDVTGGSRLPLRIRPGAPTSSLDIRPDGDVGVGTQTATSALHVVRGDGTAQLKVEETHGTAETRVLGDLTNNGAPALNFTNVAPDGADWQLAPGSDFVVKTQTGGAALTVGATGDATAAGVVQQNADAAALENRADADPATVLEAVTKLPVGYFEYIADPANVRHLAPAGADFRTAFGIGGSDATVAPADLGGVALVAIKGLAANDATLATKAQLGSLDTRVGSLDDRLRAAEAKLGSVEGSVPSLAPVNEQVAALAATNAAAQKQIDALRKQNSSLLKRLSKLEKMTKKLEKTTKKLTRRR